MWILFDVLYTILIGFFDILKKKAMQNHNFLTILTFTFIISFFMTTIVVFIFSSPFSVEPFWILVCFFKALVLGGGLLLSFYAYKYLEVSLAGPISLLTYAIYTILSCIFFGDSLTFAKIISIVLVFGCVILINANLKKKPVQSNLETNPNIQEIEVNKLHKKTFCIGLLIISSVLIAISIFLSKVIIAHADSYQMMFWTTLFMAVIYCLISLATCVKTKTKISFNYEVKNYWVYIISLFYVVGNTLCFIAYSYPEAMLSITGLIEQLSVVIQVIVGGLMFKEKQLFKKIIFLLIMVIGIATALLF